MLLLRLTQYAGAQPDHYHIEVRLEGDGLAPYAAQASFEFKLTDQDREDLRWYLEDYLQYPLDPAPKLAVRIEQRMAEVGVQLFKAVFQSSDDARDLWATLRERLDETRVEVITDVREATSIPWELVRDPKTGTPLALRARSFVRAQPQTAQRPRLPQLATGPVRILLVICRPGKTEDVPFRSVASRIIKGLSEDARQLFQLDVLRPPTFEKLGEVLRDAKAKGAPYHVIHFDGHGVYMDVQGLFERWKTSPTDEALQKALEELGVQFDPARYSPQVIYPQPPQPGNRGYLAFENPKGAHNLRLVDGAELGKLLVEAHVPVLVLNACRSAHAEASPIPAADKGGEDVHARVRAFGSLAQEVMDAGVAGVVAMRYNVYVVTAAQFVADLYAALARGQALGEAATLGRKQLAAQPLREIAYAPLPLQDWSVPVAYEAAPLALFKPSEAKIAITLRAAEAAPERGALDPNLPKAPDAGFWGRDETLLALDRAFDAQRIVLLHAYAGSGKTATAAEFARWYALTGGVQGPVLFTSFEHYRPLPRALDVIGRVFEAVLEQNGFHWLALDDEQRRALTLQILKQIPVVWIWDNVEPVTGFPAGTPSAWNAAEQRELADFLRDAQGTQAKFLLTSRRDERGWLGELPVRVTMPPMPMQERIQLAKALAARHGKPLTAVDDWRPLLQLTGGNPLTLTVVVGQALRDGLRTREQIQDYVDKLRAGEAVFEDEESQGRSKSLGASLSYGFASAFTEAERKQLALLHFFQGFVDVDALRAMGNPDAPWCLPEVRGLTREAGVALLDRTAEIGLLTAHGDGYYSIHPALPWYFKSMFEKYYPTPTPHPPLTPPASQGENVRTGEGATDTPPLSLKATGEGQGVGATRAFVEAMGELGSYYHHEYNEGNRSVITALEAEEANLLHARRLARANGWWDALTSTMQGLDELYDHTGRRAEWKQLVDEIVPDLVDPATDGPLPGREEQWGFVTEYRVRLAEEARQWAEAERLQRVQVDWTRQHTAPALAAPPESLDDTQRNVIRSLAVSLEQLAIIQREHGKPECVVPSEEAISLYHRIGDQATEAISAFNLGHAYMDIPALRNLDQAERWYRRSLELRDERDRLGRSKTIDQIGMVVHQRFLEARKSGASDKQILELANEALHAYQLSLEWAPSDALDKLALSHQHIAAIYAQTGHFDQALPHSREAIRYFDAADSLYEAANTRRNVALALADAGRFQDALDYAQAALRGFSTFGDRAADMIQRTQQLIAQIEQARRGKK
jgi:tetratricopeptide (TPR) repeat protein